MSRIFLRTFLAAAVFIFAGQLRAAEIISIAGEWRFALDRNDAGVNEKWFARDLPDKIKLPGILQTQGYGDDISTNTPWMLTLGDAWWKIQPASLREHFSQPGHVEVPFLSQPPKHYLGAAWYQRDIEIPTNWNGRRVVLFLERPHWESRAWLDDRLIGTNDSLCTPHEFELGVNLAPGKHRLTVRVDNRMLLPYRPDAHSVSDALGAAWNGIVGKIELQSTPPVWIEDVQVFPNVTNRIAHVVVHIGNISGKATTAILELEDDYLPMESLATSGHWTHKKIHLSIGVEGSDFTNDIEIPSRIGNWDEFHPQLQSLGLILKGAQADDTREVTFGFRDFHAEGSQFILNGRPVYIRATHFGGDFPLTGYPAMDVASWKKIFQTCRDYGLNSMRFHSWCPPEAAFEAADELGFYLYIEPGMWNTISPGTPMEAMLYAETERILKAYGNHPSFMMISASNEPKGRWQNVLPQWAEHFRAADPRRLYTTGTGFTDANAPGPIDRVDFSTTARFGSRQVRGPSGWFGGDYRDALAGVNLPVLAHEVGQWCAYPDFDVMKKFMGYLQPGNYDIFKYIAEQNGVLDEDKDFAWASGRFQVECYKEEIEANLRTPGLAGFQLLDLHDYLGQGTALIGVADAFWESKGYVTPEEFRKFCGPVVPLAWLKKRIFTTDEKLEADYGVANFGRDTLKTPLRFGIRDGNGKVVSGDLVWGAVTDVPVGFKGKEGNFSMDLGKLPAPAEYKLFVSVDSVTGEHFENNWNFWLYPAQVDTNTPSDVLVTHNWSEAATRLGAGGKVLFMPGNADLDPARCPPMKNVPVFWNIQMTVRPPANRTAKFDAMLGLLCDTNHPALAEFPTEPNCDWQWTPLVNNVRSVNLSQAPRSLRPIVSAIDDWNRNWRLGVIFECNVGPGRLLVSAINLERGGSGLQQLRRSLLDYMAGEKFKPSATLTPEEVASLWAKGTGAPTTESARAFDPDLNDGTIPAPKKP